MALISIFLSFYICNDTIQYNTTLTLSYRYIKVRRQVNAPWKFTQIFQGAGATIARNSVLFSSFVVYMDLLKQAIPGGLSPFWTGGFRFKIDVEGSISLY